jgi:putative redox protein
MAKITVRSMENLRQEIVSGSNLIVADEPVAEGGEDSGFDPYSLLLSSLGACTAITLRLYARNKKWNLQSVVVNLWHEKIHAEDCRDCETKEGKIDRIQRQIFLEGDLTDEQQQRLREIAQRCPVHRTLTSEIKIVDIP